MKIFLFLYPFDTYFAKLKGVYKARFDACGYDFRRINDIIDARYRQVGYQVMWLMPSTKIDPNDSLAARLISLYSTFRGVPLDDLKEPDLSLLSQDITIHEKDTIITIDLHSYFPRGKERKDHPNLELIIFEKIPKATELVLGGFHQWDCVDKLAQYAHEHGISVLVDEDTTDMFFSRTSLQGTIPLIRKNPFRLLKPGDSKRAVEERKGKPWFLPI